MSDIGSVVSVQTSSSS